MSLDFTLSEEQRSIVEQVAKIAARFDDSYWLTRDREGGFPHEFHAAFAEAGWLEIGRAHV